jgi:hypothetical protein
MTRGYIRYRSEYKYQLSSDYSVAISIRPDQKIDTDFIVLTTRGTLKILRGYAWDGPSGPVPDTPDVMRASLIHDALYQLMRHEWLSSRKFRKAADEIFRQVCKEDGVSTVSANIFYKALRKFGKPATFPENKKVVHRAPR